MSQSGGSDEGSGSPGSSGWCTLSPACDVKAVGALLEYDEGNSSNESDCAVPFCPNVLSYSINNSRYGCSNLADHG